MKLMKQLLKRMYHDYAVMIHGVDLKEIQRANVSLVKSKVPQIPSDYATFLTLTDGLYWNGLELYALNEREREKGAFKHTGIVQNHETYLSNSLLKKKLIVGEAPEELIAYYAPQNEYQIIDRYTHKVILKLPRFFDVLYFYAGDLMNKTIQTQIPNE